LGIRAQFARKQQSKENSIVSNNRQPQNDRGNDKNQKVKINMDQRTVKGPFSKPMKQHAAKKDEHHSDPKQAEFNGHDKVKPYINILSNGGEFSRATDDRHQIKNGRASFQ
jgi:hypothetical protein